MNLPFFDVASSARYLSDLLADADPPFVSVSATGTNSAALAEELSRLNPLLSLASNPAEVAISCDAVHLLPHHGRASYVKEVVASAKREAIIVCPLGTELQRTIYRSLQSLAAEKNIVVPEISDALRHGLPTPTDAASWAHGYADIDLFYAGDVAFFQEQSTRFLSQFGQPFLLKSLRKLIGQSAPAAIEADLPPETVPMRRHRRLYLLIRKR